MNHRLGRLGQATINGEIWRKLKTGASQRFEPVRTVVRKRLGDEIKKRIRRIASLTIIFWVILSFVWPAMPAAAQGYWYGEYFSNPSLVGGPTLTRYDDKIDFGWGAGSPGGGIPPDNFSARWTRDEWFESGTYRFSYRSDDGIRIWVGDTLVVDDWRDRQPTLTTADRTISRGTYRVRVEYYEHTGGATIQLGWERISGGQGWRGEYYPNRDLSGKPVLVRTDPAVDFDWKNGSPDPSVPADNFSVRWTRTLGFSGGTYRFNTSTDDGVRLYVDGKRIIDKWQNQQLPNTHSADINLGGGEHTVVVEYYEQGGEASAHVWWNLLGSFAGWQGKYYDNAELRGGPALVRDDPEINFDWGEGAPAPWMPSDNFSAVWTRQVNFTPGYYRLNVRSDDGVRVWLDNVLVMDYWRVQDYPWHYADGFYLQGLHTLKVEYFEGTGLARIRFWVEPSNVSPNPTGQAPALAPAPTPQPVTAVLGTWQGEYFNNTSLAGSPVLVRTDNVLDFDWGFGSPAQVVTKNDFSSRWTGTFSFAAGRYAFNTYSDDGVRVCVDGVRIINSWLPMRGYRSSTVNLSEGAHTVKVEYFERNGKANIRVGWQQVGVAGPTPTPQPVASAPPASKAGGPLRLDAWPVGSYCSGSGWVAKIFVEGFGGDGLYIYAWERQVQGGPTPNSMVFEVKSASKGIAIVGEVSVSSAGQTVKVGRHVPPPKCP
jgi:hypothetical protein